MQMYTSLIKNKVKKFVKNYPGVKKSRIVEDKNMLKARLSHTTIDNEMYRLKVLVTTNKDEFDAYETIEVLSGKKDFKEKVKEIAYGIFVLEFDIHSS